MDSRCIDVSIRDTRVISQSVLSCDEEQENPATIWRGLRYLSEPELSPKVAYIDQYTAENRTVSSPLETMRGALGATNTDKQSATRMFLSLAIGVERNVRLSGKALYRLSRSTATSLPIVAFVWLDRTRHDERAIPPKRSHSPFTASSAVFPFSSSLVTSLSDVLSDISNLA